jgi:hypothetical protein
LCHCYRADEEYGRRVAEGLGIDVSQKMATAHEPDL